MTHQVIRPSIKIENFLSCDILRDAKRNQTSDIYFHLILSGLASKEPLIDSE